MHKHHIKENKNGNDRFYEEWHQKLHNNTTPDDIPICEALLAYLKTSDIKQYWSTLNEAGITKERLASYDRNITSEPSYLPHTISSFENYLKILKQMHSSDDLLIQMEESEKYGDWHVHRQCEQVR